MRILVTGASGLLGLNVALEAAGEHTVFGVVNTRPLETKEFHVLQANLLNKGEVERVFEASRPDWVIHCAALANLDACERHPTLAHKLNAELPGLIASTAKERGARLVHISTDAVFDGQKGNYKETDQPHPLSVYARTKLAGERAVAEAYPKVTDHAPSAATQASAAIIARVNLYGWGLSGKRSLAEFFFNNLQAGKSVMGFTDVYFSPLLANDLGNILLNMLAENLQGLYHVGSQKSLSKYEFGVKIAENFGFDPNLIRPTALADAGLGASRSPNLSLCVDKLIHNSSISIPKLSTGLSRFYALYQQGYPQSLKEMGISD
ncbi:MAG: dTDP-4-dehydrorhamnose reductase [Chloroflexi bacterium]|nr:dTDP-4-dehydrorhamnose reductase [Chloroflexota bacterium]